MEIFTQFIHNYKNAMHGVNIVAQVLITLTLIFIAFAVISAVINVILLNV